ncbi:hypothetical protein B0O44_105361 [Pedobacter nutrimenti]|uniref:Uncharacterized protein n=1 Tax=Pedobacter nutrimenti TaxID=1241337 RepID=A0A318UEN1_9SPHI|nr:hypothetical protein B0O44_105361 [Pedobacter nutrimenti]
MIKFQTDQFFSTCCFKIPISYPSESPFFKIQLPSQNIGFIVKNILYKSKFNFIEIIGLLSYLYIFDLY